MASHPLGPHLILAESMSTAVFAVLATPTLVVEQILLHPHPTAPRAARNFVTRTLLDWRLGHVIAFASVVVSELVSRSSVEAGTDMDLCVVWDRGALRLSVRDHGPAVEGQHAETRRLHQRGLTVIAGLARVYGALPTADGGKSVWAVLDAARTQPPTRRFQPGHALASQSPPAFTDGRGVVELPFCAGSSRKPA